MDWRNLLSRSGRNLIRQRARSTVRRVQRGAVDAAAEVGRQGARRVFGQESFLSESTRNRLEGRARGERRRATRRMAVQSARKPRTRTTRRTPGGTPAQRAWRQRFAELSRSGQLPRPTRRRRARR